MSDTKPLPPTRRRVTWPLPPKRRRVTWADRLEVVKALHRERHTGVDLAGRLGITRSAVYQMLNGLMTISEATALRLHEWYGVEVRLQTHREPMKLDPVDEGAS